MKNEHEEYYFTTLETIANKDSIDSEGLTKIENTIFNLRTLLFAKSKIALTRRLFSCLEKLIKLCALSSEGSKLIKDIYIDIHSELFLSIEKNNDFILKHLQIEAYDKTARSYLEIEDYEEALKWYVTSLYWQEQYSFENKEKTYQDIDHTLLLIQLEVGLPLIIEAIQTRKDLGKYFYNLSSIIKLFSHHAKVKNFCEEIFNIGNQLIAAADINQSSKISYYLCTVWPLIIDNYDQTSKVKRKKEFLQSIFEWFAELSLNYKDPEYTEKLIDLTLKPLKSFWAANMDLYEKVYMIFKRRINEKEKLLSYKLIHLYEEILEFSNKKNGVQHNVPEFNFHQIKEELNSILPSKNQAIGLEQISYNPKDKKISVQEYRVKFLALLAKIIKHITLQLGDHPCDFCIIGHGSITNGDFSVYSDLDIAILIKDSDKRTHPFFSIFIKLLHYYLQSIGFFLFNNLKINGIQVKRLDVIGHHLDNGDLNHLLPKNEKKEHQYLLNTPKKMAKWVIKNQLAFCSAPSQENNKASHTEHTVHLSYALLFPIQIFSTSTDNMLLTDFRDALLKKLETKADNREKFIQIAVHFINEHTQQYQAIKSAKNYINLKEEYIKPFKFFCINLFIYFSWHKNKESGDIPSIINHISVHLSPSFMLELNQAWEFLNRLRFKANLVRPGPKDYFGIPYVDYIDFDEKQEILLVGQKLPMLSVMEFKQLQWIKQFILDPVHQYVTQWLKLYKTDLKSKFDPLLWLKDISDKNKHNVDFFKNLATYITESNATLNEHVNYYVQLPEITRYTYYQALQTTLEKRQHPQKKTILQRLGLIPNKDGMRCSVWQMKQQWDETLFKLLAGDDKKEANRSQLPNFLVIKAKWVTTTAEIKQCQVTPQVTKQLFDNHGQRLPKEEPDGRGWVRYIRDEQKKEILAYVKWVETPAIHMTAERLIHRISGLATVSTLVRFKVSGKKLTYPLLVSRPAGRTLRKIRRAQLFEQQQCKDISLEHIEARLHPYFFTWKVIDTLLIGCGDEKDDNLAIEEMAPMDELEASLRKNLAFFSFDNKHSFVHPVVSGNRPREQIELKSLLLVLRAMEDPINPQAWQEFESLDPNQTIDAWLRELEMINHAWLTSPEERRKGIFTPTEIRRLSDIKTQEFCFIPIAFVRGTIARIYKNFQRLQKAKKEIKFMESNVTTQIVAQQDLLFVLPQYLHPQMASLYERSLRLPEKNPQKRFEQLPMAYDIVYEEMPLSQARVMEPSSEQDQLTTASHRLEFHQSLQSSKAKIRQIITSIERKNYPNFKTALHDGYFYYLLDAVNEFKRVKEHYQMVERFRQGIQTAEKNKIDEFLALPKEANWIKERVLADTEDLENTEKINWLNLCNQHEPVVKKLLKGLARVSFRYLVLINCNLLTDGLLLPLLENSKHLHTLDLRGCQQLKGKSLTKLYSYCPYLERLYISDWILVTAIPQSFQGISAKLHLPRLKLLYIENLIQLRYLRLETPQLLKLILINCQNLEEYENGALNLYGLQVKACPKLSKISLDRLLSSSNQFKYLAIDDCPQVPIQRLALCVARDNQWYVSHCQLLLQEGNLIQEQSLVLSGLPILDYGLEKLLNQIKQQNIKIRRIEINNTKLTQMGLERIKNKFSLINSVEFVGKPEEKKITPFSPALLQKNLSFNNLKAIAEKLDFHHIVKIHPDKIENMYYHLEVDCSNIELFTFAEMGREIKEYLSVYLCPDDKKITTITIRAYQEKNKSNVKLLELILFYIRDLNKLILENCQLASFFEMLANNFEKLVEIDIHNVEIDCIAIKRKVFNHDKLPFLQLKMLKIKSCEQLELLYIDAPELVELDIDGCERLKLDSDLFFPKLGRFSVINRSDFEVDIILNIVFKNSNWSCNLKDNIELKKQLRTALQGEKLDLTLKTIRYDDILSLKYVFENPSIKLTTINFDNNDINLDTAALKVILEKVNSHLKLVDLSRNSLEEQAIQWLIHFVNHTEKTRFLIRLDDKYINTILKSGLTNNCFLAASFKIYNTNNCNRVIPFSEIVDENLQQKNLKIVCSGRINYHLFNNIIAILSNKEGTELLEIDGYGNSEQLLDFLIKKKSIRIFRGKNFLEENRRECNLEKMLELMHENRLIEFTTNFSFSELKLLKICEIIKSNCINRIKLGLEMKSIDLYYLNLLIENFNENNHIKKLELFLYDHSSPFMSLIKKGIELTYVFYCFKYDKDLFYEKNSMNYYCEIIKKGIHIKELKFSNIDDAEIELLCNTLRESTSHFEQLTLNGKFGKIGLTMLNEFLREDLHNNPLKVINAKISSCNLDSNYFCTAKAELASINYTKAQQQTLKAEIQKLKPQLDDNGDTLLHYAIRKNRLDIASIYLISVENNTHTEPEKLISLLTKKNQQGDSPCDVVLTYDHEIAKRLILVIQNKYAEWEKSMVERTISFDVFENFEKLKYVFTNDRQFTLSIKLQKQNLIINYLYSFICSNIQLIQKKYKNKISNFGSLQEIIPYVFFKGKLKSLLAQCPDSNSSLLGRIWFSPPINIKECIKDTIIATRIMHHLLAYPEERIDLSSYENDLAESGILFNFLNFISNSSADFDEIICSKPPKGVKPDYTLRTALTTDLAL